MKPKSERYEYRRERVKRYRRKASSNRPRLSVYRSLKHLYAQVVDDRRGSTLVFASSQSKELKGKLKSGKNLEAAKLVGEMVAKKALAKGIKQVCFDRGGRVYHGRVKALAEGARQAGLEF
ncbi:MAG: 50S ribosomal protein L18 [Elusimicrobia bacterium]|nr:50S ribosomal protein L18 [Elusimicrobiota bacterium]